MTIWMASGLLATTPHTIRKLVKAGRLPGEVRRRQDVFGRESGRGALHVPVGTLRKLLGR